MQQYQKKLDQLYGEFSSGENGLTTEQAVKNCEKFGRNVITEGKKKSIPMIFLEQYKDFLVLILIIAAIVSAFIDQYRGKYLNELPEFQGCENTLETIGDYFYEELRQRLEKNGMELYQLDISENPLCVYQVSDRLLLPTMNMDTSNRNYQKIFDDILRLESMTGANNLQ